MIENRTKIVHNKPEMSLKCEVKPGGPGWDRTSDLPRVNWKK